MKPTIVFQDVNFYQKHGFSMLWKRRKWVMGACLLLSDLFCIGGSVLLAMIIWRQVRTDFLWESYTSMIFPIAACLTIVYFMMGLYPGNGIGPVEELRRLTLSTTFLFLGLIALSFYTHTTIVWSRAIIGLSWFFLTTGSPISRKIFRRGALRLGLWGEPVIVIGDPENAPKITQELCNHPLTGFWPVLCVTTDSIVNIFPLLAHPSHNAWDGKSLFNDIEIVILAPRKAPFSAARNFLIDKSHPFKRIILMFDEEKLGSVWFTPLHVREHFGLETIHRLTDPVHQTIKRLIDLILILATSPLLATMCIIIAAAIKLDSRGKILYIQKRIGYDGKEIRIWKFRTMVSNAEELLGTYIENNLTLKKEWEENFKLRNDMRITRVGKFLRSSSLDELPQIWNVLRGEMSLIGPRPIVQEEISLYGEEFEIYKRVIPGMTGLWQISGRNNLPYRERVNLDTYYVQNWSIWLDIHTMIHTVLAVIQSRGAY